MKVDRIPDIDRIEDTEAGALLWLRQAFAVGYYPTNIQAYILLRLDVSGKVLSTLEEARAGRFRGRTPGGPRVF
jgi:hypothetical protein